MELMFQPLRKYADFNGRARRSEYWLFQLFFWGTLVVVSIVSTLITVPFMDPAAIDAAAIDPAAGAEGAAAPEMTPAETTAGIISLILSLFLGLFFLGMLIPNLAVRVRRLHDIGVTGWLILIGVIPFLGGLVLFIMSLIDGHVGKNDFGPDPKGRGEQQLADTFS